MERMEKQLTAVAFLVSHLDELNEMTRDEKNNVIATARAIERDAIIEAHRQASIESGFEDSAEDWANEYWDRNYGV